MNHQDKTQRTSHLRHIQADDNSWVHDPTNSEPDPISQLHRAHQAATFRFGTHHSPLNTHLHRINKGRQAKCVYCPDSDQSNLTVMKPLNTHLLRINRGLHAQCVYRPDSDETVEHTSSLHQ